MGCIKPSSHLHYHLLNIKVMKVYVVIGGWEYEGYHDDKMEIFTDKLDAEVYKLELEKKAGIVTGKHILS